MPTIRESQAKLSASMAELWGGRGEPGVLAAAGGHAAAAFVEGDHDQSAVPVGRGDDDRRRWPPGAAEEDPAGRPAVPVPAPGGPVLLVHPARTSGTTAAASSHRHAVTMSTSPPRVS